MEVERQGIITFESPAFEEAEGEHAEFFEVFGQDELTGRMGAGKGFAVPGEDVDSLFGEGAADIFERSLGHPGGSWRMISKHG